MLLAFCSFLFVINVNGETVFESSTSLLKSLVIQFFTAEACDSHVSWLISQVLVTELARALLNNSIVEWFWLIELFSVLGSVLISMSNVLGSPTCAIPES